jgi:hypothetical protein
MFGFGKKAKLEREQKLATRTVWEGVLRSRLHNLVDAVSDDLTEVHNLDPDKIASLNRISGQMKAGVDQLLIHKRDAFDSEIPDGSEGGAIIANSVHAWFFVALNLGCIEECEMFATERDQKTVGDIRWFLGFSRDGWSVRETHPS